MSDGVMPEPRPRWMRPIPTTLIAALLIVAGLVAYRRTTVYANVDVIEWNQDYTGGFVAFGWTERQPGILVLSELERQAVELYATRDVLRTHTHVHLATPAGQVEHTLVRPQVLLVEQSGKIQTVDVDWDRDRFQMLSDAADCKTTAARCGRPLADLARVVRGWSAEELPRTVGAFLLRHHALDHGTVTSGTTPKKSSDSGF